MAHTLIITAFGPDFTPNLRQWIKTNIEASMVNPKDDNNKSYFLQEIIDAGLIMAEEDKILIQELLTQNVEYVEF